MFCFDLGDIYLLEVAYEDNPDESKLRPVIIVGKEAETVLILVATTSQSPSNPPKFYDRFKIPIKNWRKAGLHKPSWVLGYRLITLTAKEFEEAVTKESFIGKIDEVDFKYLIKQLELIHRG